MATRRRFTVALGLGLPALLAGCGWEPLYANHETEQASSALQAITVNPINDRVGQRLEFALRSSFNPSNDPTKPIYKLFVSISTSLADLGVQSQGLGTRGDAHLYATYRLVEIASNKVLQTASIHTIDSFDIQANGYSTVVAEDDAFRRCVEEARREIVTRLTLFLQSRTATAAS
jgi:LPS-assembly lipoprotein